MPDQLSSAYVCPLIYFEDDKHLVEFDTLIHSEPLDDKDDPGCMVDLAVVGEREDNVDNLLAINRYWLPHCTYQS